MRSQLTQVHSLFRKFDNKVERFSISGHISFCLVSESVPILCKKDWKLRIIVTSKSIFHKDWFLYLSCPLYRFGKVRIFEFSSKWISLCVHFFCVLWICDFFPLIQCVYVNTNVECKSLKCWICLSENNMLFWFQSTSSSWIVIVLIIGSIDCNFMRWSRHEVNQHSDKLWFIFWRSSEWRNIDLHKVFLFIQCINWWFIFNFCDFFDVSLNHMWKYYVIINEIIFRILLLANYEMNSFLKYGNTVWYVQKNAFDSMTKNIHFGQSLSYESESEATSSFAINTFQFGKTTNFVFLQSSSQSWNIAFSISTQMTLSR